jgi:polyhydroxybutyrate depolymerase
MQVSRGLAARIALSLALSGCGESGDGGTPAASAGSGANAAGSGGRGPQGNAGTSNGTPNPQPSAGAGGTTNSGGSPPVAVESAGCGKAAAFTSGNHELEVGGATRTFIVDLPNGYDEDEAYPLLFGFHGRGFSAAEFRSSSYGNMLSAASSEAIVVHPDALGEPERAWATETDRDLVFFDGLFEALTAGLCVDESRVFATGHSSGGYFTNLLGCERGNLLRAIAPVAGGGPFGTGGREPVCERPLSAWIAHAENDQTVLFSNGEGSLDYWLTSDDCNESSRPTSPAPCVAYSGCAGGLAVHWCVYETGHDWPTFAPGGIWSFFDSL